MDQGHGEKHSGLKKNSDKGFKSIQNHIDRSIDFVAKSVQEDREKDIVLQVGFYFYDNLLF